MSNVSKLLINKPRTLLILITILFVWGSYSFSTLEKETESISENESICIVTEYPGKSSGEIEKRITSKIEEHLKSVSGIKDQYSLTENGRSRIFITISKSPELQNILSEIRMQTEKAASAFPGDCRRPCIYRGSADEKAKLIISIYSENNTVPNYEDIKPSAEKFLLIENITQMKISGKRNSRLVIRPAMNVLEKNFNFSNYISGTIQQLTKNKVFQNKCKFLSEEYSLNGQISSEYNLRESIVPKSKNIFSIIKNQYSAKRESTAPEKISLFNGSPNITLYIYSNQSREPDDLEKTIKEFQEIIRQKNLKSQIIFNYFQENKNRFHKTILSLIAGIILISIMVIIFTANPVNLIALLLNILITASISAIILKITDTKITTSILISLSILSGIIADLPLMTINPFLKSYKTRQSIITYSVITTLAVFLPLIFFCDRKIIFNIAFTFTVVTLCSLLVIRTIFPALIVYSASITKFLKSWNFFFYRKLLQNSYKIHFHFNIDSNPILYQFYNIFKINKKSIKEIIITIAISIAIFFVIINPIPPITNDNTPSKNILSVRVFFNSGLTKEYTLKCSNIINQFLKNKTDVKYYTAEITPSSAEYLIKLKENSHLTKELILGEIRNLTNATVVDNTIQETERNIYKKKYQFYGDDVQVIREEVIRLGEKIFAAFSPEIIYHFTEGKPGYLVEFDKAINPDKEIFISRELRTLLSEPVIAKYKILGMEEDIVLNIQKPNSLSQLISLAINVNEGEIIPLKGIMKIKKNTTPSILKRQNYCNMESLTVISDNCKQMTGIDKFIHKFNFKKDIILKEDKSINEAKIFFAENINILLLCPLIIIICTAAVDNSFRFVIPILLNLLFSTLCTYVGIILFKVQITPAVLLASAVSMGLSVNYPAVVLFSINESKENNSEIEKKFIYLMGMAISTISGIIPLLFFHEKNTFEFNFSFIIIITTISSYIYTRFLLRRIIELNSLILSMKQRFNR